MLTRRAALVPVTNQVVQRQVTLALAELKRARAIEGNDLREIWFEEQMNAGLDVLLARGYGKAG